VGGGRAALSCLALAWSVLAGAPALAASVTASVELKVVQPFTIARTADLAFGALVPGSTGGTVTIDPASGSRTVAGSVTAVGSGYGAAHFATAGEPNQHINVKLPRQPVTLTRIGGGATMTADAFARSGTPPNAVRLDAGGQFDFYVGATLDVGASQPPGTYVGTFDVEVTYQ
jgi:hypothetical protein